MIGLLNDIDEVIKVILMNHEIQINPMNRMSQVIQVTQRDSGDLYGPDIKQRGTDFLSKNCLTILLATGHRQRNCKPSCSLIILCNDNDD